MYTRVVSVLSNAGTGTQDITFTGGTSFTPKLAIFQWSRANTSADTFQEHMSSGYGFCDGTNQRCIAVASEDNAARGDSARIQRNDAVVCTLNPSGTIETVDSLASFSQWLTDGIQINWTDAPAAQFYLTVLLIGGDDVSNIAIGSILTTTGASASLSSLSWQPENGLFLSIGSTTENSPVTSAISCIGAYDGTTQWTQGYLSQDNPVTMITRQNYQHARVMDIPTTAGATDGYSTIAWTSTGFTLTNTDTYSASFPIYYLVWKGGTFTAGYATEPAGTGQQTLTTNEDVQAVMVFGVDSGTAGWQTGAMITSGMATSTTERYVDVFEDTNGVADSIVVSRHDTDQLYLNITSNATATSSTLDDEATFYSKSATNVIINWTNIGQARPFRYITFGSGQILVSISETAVTVSDSVSIYVPENHIEPPDTPGPNRKAIVAGNEFTITEGSANPTYIPLLGTQWSPRDNTTESYAKWKVRPYGGTFSNLTLSTHSNSVGSTATIRVRKNSANGNQVLSISSGSTGTFEDTTHTDIFANGDFFSISNTWTYVASSSNSMSGDLRIVFKSTNTNTVTQYGAVDGSINSASSTTYIGLAGYATDSGLDNTKTKFKTQIVLRNLQTVVSSNARTSSTTLRIYKSNVPSGNGRQSISIGSGVTGHLEDTSSDTEDVITADNYAAYKVITGTGSETTELFLVSVSGESYDGVSNILGRSSAIDFGQTAYTSFAGWLIVSTAGEILGLTADKILFDSTWRNSNVYLYSNTINSGTSTFTARKNLTTNLSISYSIAAGASGLFEDAVNTASLAASDSVSIKTVTSGTSGSLNIGTMNNEFLESVTGELKYGTITESPSISVSESLTRLQVIIKPISDTPTVSVSESLVRIQTLTRPISDTPTISISEILTRGLSYPRPITNEPEVSVSAGTLERIQYLIKLITNEPDVTIPAETIAKIAAYPRPISDTPAITVSETLEKILTDIRAITNEPDVSIPEETLSKYSIRPRSISDTPSVTVSESLERIQSIIKLITNEPEITISELIAGNFLISRIINETPSVSVSETLERIQYLIKLITETPEVTISELLEGSLPVKSRSITEPSIDTTPTTIERLVTFARSITLTEEPLVSVNETIASILSYLRNITNEPDVTTSEIVSILTSIIRTLTEPSIDTTPTTVERTAAFTRSITLTDEPLIDVSDTLARLLLYLRNITNEPDVTTSDVATILALITRTLTEPSTNISEDLARIQSLIKLISETPSISTDDSVTAGMLLIVSLLESRIKWYYSLVTRKIPEGET